jgi:hypothetical protein
MSLLFDIVKGVQGKPITKVSPEIQALRIRTCEGCPFMNLKSRSCGTYLMGGTVDYMGQKMELCGCNLDDKTTYEDDGCPLYKW